ncbi:conjugal transfer protein TraG N-terminal domain-containing protein [Yersinia intermedia]|uniref:conjugal transfer protein TraG N-terminal domain-containing protein n=1 Tax=Yersinia intermedia TaxID=631 RepID=UPI00065DB082|nr:conjugal transfer protein TraG N-terminal domain-containing protein [Yersinia intermedia]CRY84124.1 TraG-like protein%2C N-terminal region [Yersinia intermedia]
MDFNIYTLGDIDFVYSAFNGIALIFSKYKGSREFMTTAACLAAGHLFFKTTMWLMNPTKNEVPIWNWIVGLIMFSICVVRVDITLESVKTGEVRAVDDIPLFIAVSGTLTTNLSQGLLRDYKQVFDPLAPQDFGATTLDQDMSLGPMVKFVKFIEWGGDSQGYCSQFPTPASYASVGNLNACQTIQSVARDCLKPTENTAGKIVAKENVFNDIYSSNLADVLAKLDEKISSGMKNASARLIGTNGSISLPCADAWSATRNVLATPEAQSLMLKIGQVNGVLSPEDASGQTGNANFTAVLNSADAMFNKAIQSHDAMIALFVMNSMRKGEQQYKSALGVATEMQMFEATMKRTNAMVSQGQLWQQLSGAAISFLEMFSYMVAPFFLLMLIALGGNGILSAAKYLQLVVFVNMWPITAVMINAYVKMVVSQNLDTWTTMNSSNNAISWNGLPAVAENYSSYLAVASALYAMIPMLTLFVMTQSIHPMMSAAKGMTPDAPVNTGHLTPGVWRAPESGSSAFGDDNRKSMISTGQGFNQGGSVSTALPRIGDFKVGSQASDTLSSMASSSQSNIQQQTRASQQSFSQMKELASGSQHSETSSKGLNSTIDSAEQLASNMANSISKSTGLGHEASKAVALSTVMSAGAKVAADAGSGGAGGIKAGLSGGMAAQLKGDTHMSDSLKTAVSEAYSKELSSNSGLVQKVGQSFSHLSSDAFTQSAAMKDAFSQVQQSAQSISDSQTVSAATQAQASGSSGLQTSQTVNMDTVSDSLRKPVTEQGVRELARSSGLDEQKFVDRYNEHLKTFSSSNTLGEGINSRDALTATVRDSVEGKMRLDSGESVSHNMQDLKESAGLLKNFSSMFGANAQILAPAIRTLDAMTGTTSAASYVSEKSNQLGAPDTSRVQSDTAISGQGSNVSGASDRRMSTGQIAASATPDARVNGMTAGEVTPDRGKAAVVNNDSDNADRAFSTDELGGLRHAQDTVSPVTKSKSVELSNVSGRLEGAGGIADKASETLLPTTPNDLNGPTSAARSSLKTNIVPLAKEVFDSQSANLSPDTRRQEMLKQAVLNREISNMTVNGEGSEARQTSEDYRKALNSEGISVSPSDLDRMARASSSSRNGGVGLDDVVKTNMPSPSYLNQHMPLVPGTSTSLGRSNVTPVDKVIGNQLSNNDANGSQLVGKKDALEDKFMNGAKGLTSSMGLSEDMLTNRVNVSGSESRLGDMTNGKLLGGNLVDSMASVPQLNNVLNNGVNGIIGLNDSKREDLEDTRDTLKSNIHTRLSQDPHYGPDVAEKFDQWQRTQPENIGKSDATASAIEFLNSNRK